MKLTMYSIGSSALILIGLVVAYAAAGGTSFDLEFLAGANYSPALQSWAFPVLFLGFAVLAGIWPFHTWAPTGHVAAPTAASMLLAGVVMKLGAFGALCVAMPLFPLGFRAVETGDRRAGGDWNRLRRVHRAVAEGPEIRDRLFERESHGLCPVRTGGGDPLGACAARCCR